MSISKPISKFPEYSELVELSTHYYKNQLKIVLKTDYDILYLLELSNLDSSDATFEISLLMFNSESDRAVYHIAEHTSQYILNKLEEHEESRFEDDFSEPGKFVSWCLLSDLFSELNGILNDCESV